MAIIKCSKCGGNISEHALECVHCGYNMEKRQCPECEGLVVSNSKFCTLCGFPFKDVNSTISMSTTKKCYTQNSLSERFKALERNSKIALIAGGLSFFLGDFYIFQLVAILLGASVLNKKDEISQNNKDNKIAAIIGLVLGLLYLYVVIYKANQYVPKYTPTIYKPSS